jgi:hypothetical protein
VGRGHVSLLINLDTAHSKPVRSIGHPLKTNVFSNIDLRNVKDRVLTRQTWRRFRWPRGPLTSSETRKTWRRGTWASVNIDHFRHWALQTF